MHQNVLLAQKPRNTEAKATKYRSLSGALIAPARWLSNHAFIKQGMLTTR